MGVADGELHADQAARDEAAQELAPKRLSFGGADVETDDLAPAALMDGVGDHHALARDAAAVAHLLDLGVHEQIRIGTLQRPLPERLDLLVEQPGDPAHFRPTDAQPEALDELVDPARGDAAHIGLLHHRHQRPLAAPARLQEARKVAALPQLGDLQIDLARARVPAPRPIAVAVRGPVIGPALAELGPDQLRDLGLHDLRRDRLNRLADHVRVLIAQHLPDDLLDRHPVCSGHRRCLLLVEA